MKEKNNTKKRGSLIVNLYHFLSAYRFIALVTIGVVVLVVITLFVLELLLPQYVHLFDYSLSKRTFTELIGSANYNAAINFYEHKKDLFNESLDNSEHLLLLSDCYENIGDYGKAEQILLELYNFNHLTERQQDEAKRLNAGEIDIIKFGIAKELCGVYAKMGDNVGYEEYYLKMKSHITDSADLAIKKMVEQNRDEFLGTYSLEGASLLGDIRMLYLKHPESVSDSLGFYLEKMSLYQSRPDETLQEFTDLIRWVINTEGIIEAYPIIIKAIDFADVNMPKIGNKLPLAELSDLCYTANDYINAKKFYIEYKRFVSDQYSDTDLEFLFCQYRGFKYIEEKGNYDKLIKQMQKCYDSLRQIILLNFHNMNEYQREHFVLLLTEPFDYAQQLLTRHPSDELAEICYENTIFMKGLLLRSNNAIQKAIHRSGDTELIDMYNELLGYKKEMTYRTGLHNVGNSLAIKSLEKKIYELDKSISYRCSDYAKATMVESFSSDDIRNSLQSDESVLEFIETSAGDLYALLIRRKAPIQYIPLVNKDEISLILKQEIGFLYSDQNLTERIWKPIEKHLDNVNTIYYSTSGLFNRLSLQCLPINESTYVGDVYNMKLLSNTANVALPGDLSPSLTSQYYASVWGDINYGASDLTIESNNNLRSAITRGDRIGHLRYSSREVENITATLTDNGVSVNLYTGDSATEQSFRNRSAQGDYILHLSTHGFFEEGDAFASYTNKMYNSGLFMAGADSTWNGNLQHGPNDGILRADEIQHMDFSNCHMVVLSACETGLGYNESNEGVYGLQRAFKLAGVDKVLMSLWKVSDYHTTELMILLYENIANGMDVNSALKSAQQNIRKDNTSPFYWGGFVLLD